MGSQVEPKAFLANIGTQIQSEFAKNRSLMSFEEYLKLYAASPRLQARNAAQYLMGAIDSFGTEQVAHPTGKIRRFKIFDGLGETRVAGQEEVQNAIYRSIGNFVRAGRINKLILMHGPNGSAKSSIAEALKRGLEAYSQTAEGALYTFNWIFPNEKLAKGNIGFGDQRVPSGTLESFAYLDADDIAVKLSSSMRESPLFLIPKPERRRLLEAAGGPDFVVPAYLLEGELSTKSRRIFDALLANYHGDWFKVLRHVQVERFYISRRYQVGTYTVEPQLSVDASYQQLSADRTQVNLPPALHSTIMFEPQGPLVSANRGLIEYADLLKRPLEAFKYLLGFSETGEVPLEHMVLQLDEILIASTNEKHLAAFKDLPDFASFKGRIELIRVPYLRRWKIECEIYDAQVSTKNVGRHVAPHATEVAALWAVLTRLKKPMAERFSGEARHLVERLTPMEKVLLYQEAIAPRRLAQQERKELRKMVGDLYEESDAYPNYEGRSGASAREIKTALFNAAQSREHESLHPLAVLKELRALTLDRSSYDFLQQDIIDGFHDHAGFVEVVKTWYLDEVDREVRESMGLVSEGQYGEFFERYAQAVSAWVTGDRVSNRLTGTHDKPDEALMASFEELVMARGDDSIGFRKSLIATIGAWRLDNPDTPVDYALIFPELFTRLSEHFYAERKEKLTHAVENVLKYLAPGETASLSGRERQIARATLDEMARRFGYSDDSARDSIVFLVKHRYAA